MVKLMKMRNKSRNMMKHIRKRKKMRRMVKLTGKKGDCDTYEEDGKNQKGGENCGKGENEKEVNVGEEG